MWVAFWVRDFTRGRSPLAECPDLLARRSDKGIDNLLAPSSLAFLRRLQPEVDQPADRFGLSRKVWLLSTPFCQALKQIVGECHNLASAHAADIAAGIADFNDIKLPVDI